MLFFCSNKIKKKKDSIFQCKIIIYYYDITLTSISIIEIVLVDASKKI